MDALLSYCRDELLGRHACHTVILYGSHARGDATPASDFDLVGFSAGAPAKLRDARLHEGRYLDLFVFPPADYAKAREEHLYMRGGKILHDERGEGARFLRELDQLHGTPPPPLPEDEKQARRVWARKMIERGARGDLEGNFRLAALKAALLEDYFALRDRRYAGSKEAFAWMAAHDPETHAAFARALAPKAGVPELEALLARI